MTKSYLWASVPKEVSRLTHIQYLKTYWKDPHVTKEVGSSGCLLPSRYSSYRQDKGTRLGRGKKDSKGELIIIKFRTGKGKARKEKEYGWEWGCFKNRVRKYQEMEDRRLCWWWSGKVPCCVALLYYFSREWYDAIFVGATVYDQPMSPGTWGSTWVSFQRSSLLAASTAGTGPAYILYKINKVFWGLCCTWGKQNCLWSLNSKTLQYCGFRSSPEN